MKTKFIPVSEAVPGMHIAKDVYTFNAILLINKGSALTDRIITRLMFYNIEEIEIIVSSKESNSTDEFKDKQINSISENEKKVIEEFNESTYACVSSLKTTLNDSLINGKELNASKLLDDVDYVVQKSRNSFHLISLLNTMSHRDDVIFSHSVNVAMLAKMLGQILDFDARNLNTLVLSALLHDVGKLAIPQRILKSSQRLTEYDLAIVKTHPTKGYELLTKQDMPLSIKNVALMHHERCDGSGYPNGLKSSEIDKFAKIVAIIDCYEAMTAPRAYRDIINPFEVIEFFEGEGLRLFDPEYLIPFINGIVESYINKKVLLSNNETGTIILINKLALSKPMIKLDSGKFIDLYSDRSVSISRVLI